MDLACLLLSSVISVRLRFDMEDVSVYVFNHLEAGCCFSAASSSPTTCRKLSPAVHLLAVQPHRHVGFLAAVRAVDSQHHLYAWFVSVLGRGVLF